tara:strand:- start:18978 stop:20936 length:1959 start_codon:yes stop_codon:yes gene_type:complete
MSSSSSSSNNIISKEIYDLDIVQGNNTIIPFSCFPESGEATTTDINFSAEVAAPSLEYDEIFKVTNAATNSSTETYVPEDDNTQYKHDNITHVDIIAKDPSGIREINVRSQNELYTTEEIQSSFLIPKFSWDITNFSNVVSSSEDDYIGSVWAGSDDNLLHNIQYSLDSADVALSANAASEITSIVFDKNSSRTFVSQYDHLSRYSIGNYLDGGVEIEEDLAILNPNDDLISEVRASNVWSVQAYSGKVISRDKDTLLINNEYDGFDSPNKILWSDFFDAFIVAGTHVIWKLQNGTKTVIYQIDEYSINDIAVSDNGQLCIILEGVDSKIKIFENDLYTFLVDQTLDLFAKKCIYCNQGDFYIIAESNTDADTYLSSHYLYNIKDDTLIKVDSISEAITTTTTTTAIATTDIIEIDAPSSGDSIELEEVIDILWRSTKSLNDTVKIELYKDGSLIDTISESTGNTGAFNWVVASSYEDGTDYQVKVTWLTPNNVSDNSDISDNFSILSEVSTTTTTTSIATVLEKVSAITYNDRNNDVVVALKNGLIGVFDVDTKDFYGMFDVGLTSINAISSRDVLGETAKAFSQVRLFVGSDYYLSDKWDSGVIETSLSSMYYGGGDNLTPGEKYYVNIQVFTDGLGWSKVQTKEWIMPK